jgi:hypothetical protein
MKDRMVWRSRWAALGAAVAVSIGGGGVFLASAAGIPTNESTIVNIAPVRVLDTRDPVNVGLPGPFVSAVSQKLQITGAVPTTAGTQSPVPAGATGVLLNVTAVNPTANGFISVRPGDATGAPATSSLNVNAGSNVPNAVQVALPTAGANAGKIDITWDAYGVAGPTTEILVDIVGYTTNAGLQALAAEVASKANTADVYTKAQTDAKFATSAKLTLSTAGFTADNSIVNWTNGCVRQDVAPFTVRAGLQLPVGVTITRISGYLIDSNAANGTLRLVRVTGVNTALATVSTAGTPGLHQLSVALVTPEVVNAGEYFFIEYIGGDGTSSHQACGAEVEYSIPPGQSLLDGPTVQNPDAGASTGAD